MREVEYSTKSLRVDDFRLFQKASAGDIEALIELVLRRTDLQEDEILALDEDEMTQVLKGIIEGALRSRVLRNMGKGFE